MNTDIGRWITEWDPLGARLTSYQRESLTKWITQHLSSSATSPIVVSWDWKAQPNFDEIGAAVRGLSKGQCDIREVPVLGGDDYAVVIADHPLNDEQAQAAWDALAAAQSEDKR